MLIFTVFSERLPGLTVLRRRPGAVIVMVEAINLNKFLFLTYQRNQSAISFVWLGNQRQNYLNLLMEI